MQNTLRGITGGIVLIAFAIAFFFAQWGYFLPVLFAGIAFAVLVGSFSSVNAKGIYGGFQGFIWLLGLAFCFLPGVGFWPWILVIAGISVILGAFTVPIVNGLRGMSLFGGTTLANRQPLTPSQEGGQRYANPQQDS
jgi:hypothetical protein